MDVLHSLEDLQNWQRQSGWFKLIGGFVPTMGALHEGHLSLIRRAAERCDLVVVSILVNPTQFNDTKDFEAYPRFLDDDAKLAKSAGAHALFAPSAEELYGGIPKATPIHWGAITHAFEGAQRPGHFDGVVAVVDLLFKAVQPRLSVFGEKDLQQVAVVKELARQRHPQVNIEVGPLIREDSGLAMSSRNRRLSEQGLKQALELQRTLRAVAEAFSHDRDCESLLEVERRRWRTLEGMELEYLNVLDATTFESFRPGTKGCWHAVIAAQVEGIRLIDNIRLNPRDSIMRRTDKDFGTSQEINRDEHA